MAWLLEIWFEDVWLYQPDCYHAGGMLPAAQAYPSSRRLGKSYRETVLVGGRIFWPGGAIDVFFRRFCFSVMFFSAENRRFKHDPKQSGRVMAWLADPPP